MRPGSCPTYRVDECGDLGLHYAWPGNFRELEQCLRNFAIRGEYQPPRPVNTSGGEEDFARAMEEGAWTAEELMRRYCTLVYARCRNYEEVARRLGVDRRTVRKYVTAIEGAE
jgi:DNA-binding NtrC family response regulator